MENKEIKLSTNTIDILSIENSLEHQLLSKECIMENLRNNTTSYLVYYVNNISIGYLAFSNCIDHIDIISIAVKPEYRNKGVAKLLFKHLDTLNLEMLPIFLEVRISNTPAIGLYTSLGFKNISKRRNYYTSPSEDALIYAKNIIEPN